MRRILAVAGAGVLFVGYSSIAASETDPTVKDFVAACSVVKHVKHQKDSDAYIDCLNKMAFSEMAPDYCPPQSMDTMPDDVLVATIAWLKRHPDMSSMDQNAGILIALKAMYCR